MSLEVGSALIDRFISIVGGESEPNPSEPYEVMMKEVWDNLASIDEVLTDEMREPAITFWRSQVAPERLAPKTVRSYLRYREDDIASAYVHAPSPLQFHLFSPFPSPRSPSIGPSNPTPDP